jgi:hypothetical protein
MRTNSASVWKRQVIIPVRHIHFVSHTRLHTTLYHSILYKAVRHPQQTCPKFYVQIVVPQIYYLTILSQRNLWGLQQKPVIQLGLFIYGKVSRDSSVGTATGYGLDGPKIESWCRRYFPHPSRTAHPTAFTMDTGSFPG